MKEKRVIVLVLAVLAGIVFPVAIACQSHLFADGAYFFIKILESGKIGAVGATPARMGHHLLTQGPIILARQLGLSHGRVLSRIYGAVLFYFPWVLYASASMLFLKARRPMYALLAVFLYLLLLLFAGFFIISESHLAAACFILTLAVLTVGDLQKRPFQLGVIVLGLLGMSLYERWAIYFPVLFAILAIQRPFRCPRWLFLGLGVLYGIGTTVNIYAMMVSPVAANRDAIGGSFLTTWPLAFVALAVFVGALALAVGPMCWRSGGTSGEPLPGHGFLLSHTNPIRAWAEVILLVGMIAVVAVLGGIGVIRGLLGAPRFAYALRVLNLGLPLLFAVSLAAPFCGEREKPRGVRRSLLIAGVFGLLIVVDFRTFQPQLI